MKALKGHYLANKMMKKDFFTKDIFACFRGLWQ